MRYWNCWRAARLAPPITVVTRLRLDVALYDPVPARDGRTVGRPRCKGKRQPTLAHRLTDPAMHWQDLIVQWYGGRKRQIEVVSATAVWYHSGMPPVPVRWVLIRDPKGRFDPQALLCTNLNVTAHQIVEWFVLRWQLEVTFHEVRTHLGVETQRQWSDLAILRTTPALLGLFSLVTLFAHQLLQGTALPVRSAAWYPKAVPTFADTLAVVRMQLWPMSISYMSPAKPDMVEIPRVLFQRLIDTLACAA